MPTPPRPARPRRLAGLSALALALAVVGAACGDDDDPAASEDTTAADVDLASYCADEVELDGLFKLADADDPDAFPQFLVDARAVVDRVVAGAPDELAEPFEVLEAGFSEVEATGDPEAFFTDEVGAADDQVHAFDLDHCGWGTVDVEAADYSFAGDLPTEPGTVSFEVRNAGEELHVMVLAKKLATVEAPALDAFQALESEEALAGSFDVVTQAFAVPGDGEYAVAELTEGEYVLFCPIPVGSVLGAEGPTPGDGAPHFTQGMVTSFAIGD